MIIWQLTENVKRKRFFHKQGVFSYIKNVLCKAIPLSNGPKMEEMNEGQKSHRGASLLKKRHEHWI